MRSRDTAAWLYLINTVLLTVHEIDSAYWHEWQLLRLPGGIDMFLLVHIPILGVVLYGFRRVVLWQQGARAFSYVLAAMGITAFSLHMILIAAGLPGFREPVSLAVLAAVLALSGLQILVVSRVPAE